MFNFWEKRRGKGKGKCRRRRKRGFGRAGWRCTSMPATPVPKEQTIIATDETLRKAEEIYKLLPKKDCGACGFDSCYETAVMIAKGLAPPDACKVVGKKIKEDVERILNS